MSAAPSRMAGLADRKGGLVAGLEADFVVFDDAAEQTVDASRLEHRHAVTPYHGCRLRGVVEQTWLRGRRVYHHGEPSAAPLGRTRRRAAPSAEEL
jgi:allantoinase